LNRDTGGTGKKRGSWKKIFEGKGFAKRNKLAEGALLELSWGSQISFKKEQPGKKRGNSGRTCKLDPEMQQKKK